MVGLTWLPEVCEKSIFCDVLLDGLEYKMAESVGT